MDNKVPTLEQFSWQTPVISFSTDIPPSPNKGDRYLIPTGATGVWAAHIWDIATYTGSIWEYTTTREGHTVWIKNTDKLFIFTGSVWTDLRETGLFDIDINGDLEPHSDGVLDDVYELDGNSDIQPKA